MNTLNLTNNRGITIAIFVVVMSFSFIACGDKTESVIIEGERHEIPSLKEYDIITIISDSGITRYRLTSQELLVYDKASEPHSIFPQGVYLERFDQNYNIDAHLTANRAKYFEQKALWQLNDSVKIVNLEGEIFETDELFWNQNEGRIYTEQFMKITQSDKIITGDGFESNETMTQYVIKRPKGIFQMGDEGELVEIEGEPQTENESQTEN